jgi:diacylglycerol kinase family enzyme
MNDLFGSPIQWSASVASTWLRFWFFACAMTGLLAWVVYLAAFEGWRSALGVALLLALYQLMFLYAMRRMYLQITGQKQREMYAV